MNLKLEELRKRLLDPVPGSGAPSSSVYRRSSSELYPEQAHQAEEIPLAADSTPAQASTPTSTAPATPEKPSVTSAVLDYVQRTATASEEESIDSDGQYQLAQAVAKVFEQTKTFQDRFAELNRTFEPIEQAGTAAAHALEPLKMFERQLVRLAESFQPMRAFQFQLAELAQTFEPMKGLQQQLAQLSEAFQIHLARLAKSLDPAKEFQAELLKLARAFDPVADLQRQFVGLVDTFKAAPIPAMEKTAGASAPIQH
jgi:hypothetical protein